MKLSDLWPDYRGEHDPEIEGVTADSRGVKKGSLFVAVPGRKYDGCAFIDDALAHGAVAVVAPGGCTGSDQIPLIVVDNPRQALSQIAARFYGRQPDHIVAVTGTNGKTSTVHFTQQLWQMMGHKAASLGTLGVRGAKLARPGAMTTPDPVELHAMVADVAAAGITHLALEASSHGIEQYRLDGLKITAAAFTNLTRDHLDYHGSMEAYFAAKERLFAELVQDGGTAVLNADVPEYKALKATAEGRGLHVMSYGEKGETLRLAHATPQPDGQDIIIEFAGRRYDMHLPLVGRFQAMNVLCALGLLMAENGGNKTLAEAIVHLPNLKRAPGRLELVPGHPKGAVYVDYAHTPNALEMILKALRPHTQGRLICVVGCGGDRDKGKRPIMGKIAADLADKVIITDDNPRSEDPATIRAEVLEGAGPKALEIEGRREAIRRAVRDMDKGDVLVIAGKGHEQGQIFVNHTEYFDDVEEAQNAIGELHS